MNALLELPHPSVHELLGKVTHCLNCGCRLKYLTRDKRRNRGYCSMGCLSRKPLKFAYAERFYGKPIRQVMVEVLNTSQSMEEAAERLGVYRQALYMQMAKEGIRKLGVYT